jgi:PAS domain S-box-containing protein
MSVKELEKTSKIMLQESKVHNDLQTLKLNLLQLLSPANDYLVHGNDIEFVNFLKFDSITKAQIIISKKYSAFHIKKMFINNLEESFKKIEQLNEEIFNIKNPIGSADGVIKMEDMEALTNKVINDLDEILLIESSDMEHYLNVNQATNIRATQIIITVGLFLAICLVVGGFFYVKEITQPIKQLKQTAKKISLGDLSIKADIKTRTQDEIDDFSNSFNEMIGVLEKTTVSRAYFTNILNKMADTLIITDTTGKIKIVNKAVIDLLEYEEEELIGQPFEKILSKDFVKETFPAVDIISKLQEDKEQNIYNVYYSKSKKALPVSFSRSIMYDKQDKIKGILCIAQHNMDSFKDKEEMAEVNIENDFRNIKTIGKIPLTKRELEIIKLIIKEMSNREIAEKLFISVRTVETHRKNIMRKLHTKSVIALVHYAIQNDII